MSILIIKANSAMETASRHLQDAGLSISAVPDSAVTHLLLPIPSRGDFTKFLSRLPPEITVYGGNLESSQFRPFRTVDFLKDPLYMEANAGITARCALQLPKIDFTGVPALVLGWGRIGKHLSALLLEQGAHVTVSARNPMDLAKISKLGMNAVPLSRIQDTLLDHRLIFNTIPAMVLPDLRCHPACLVYELASQPGMSGPNIISALGLPGKYAPKESGILIAETVMRNLSQEGLL